MDHHVLYLVNFCLKQMFAFQSVKKHTQCRWVFARKIIAWCIACITARKKREHAHIDTYLGTACNGVIL